MAKRTCLVLGLMTVLLLPPAPVRAQPAGQSAPGAAAGTAGAGEAEISPKEKQLLEKIRRMKEPRWRSFGICRYDWSAWRLSEGGVRSTDVECGNPPVKGTVAVHCETLRVTRRGDDGAWKPWRLPLSIDESAEMGGEDVMVASLCANLSPTAPAARPARPTAPPSPGTAKPAETAKPKAP